MTGSTGRYRPAFHFTPREHWMNDPNGLVHVDGTWHLYFQYNPEGDSWGNMSWGHASSTDLVHWTEHPVALRYQGAGVHAEAVYSGSVVVDRANTSGLAGTGPGPMVAVYTSAYGTGRQAQSIATSHDGRTWTRWAANPVLDRGSRAFRDPKVTWYPLSTEPGGYWLMTAVEAEARQVLFYRSDDLRSWRLLSQFGPLPEPAGFWECPDLFELPVDSDPTRTRHVLLLSANDERDATGCGTWYAVGQFDGRTFAMDEPGFRRLDHGWDCYAAVTWDQAPDGRRVLIGWMNNWSYAAATPTHPWRGAMTVPRELTLETRDGCILLVQRPVAELEIAGISGRQLTLGDVPDRPDVVDLVHSPGGDVRMAFDPASRTLTLDRTAAAGTSFHHDFPQTTAIRVPGHGRVDVRVLADACSVEVFVDDGAYVLTALAFPSEADGTPVLS